MHKYSVSFVLVVVIVVSAMLIPRISPAQGSASVAEDVEKTVHVSLAVMAENGEPVAGLEPSELTVLEDGRSVNIDRLVEVGTADATDVPVHTVVVFDNRSLQKRRRAELIEVLKPFVRRGCQLGHQMMVVTLPEEGETVRSFTGGTERLQSALDSVAATETEGEKSASRRRTLRRDVASASTTRDAFAGNTAPQFAGDDAFGSLQTQRLKSELDEFRRSEFNRVRQSVLQLAGLLESLSGVPGVEHVVVATENLTMWPGLDVYRVLFRQLGTQAQALNLTPPDVWRQEMELSAQFGMLSNVAQASGIAVHIIDAYDQERDRGDMDFSEQDMRSFYASGTDSLATMGEDDLGASQDVTAGSRYVARTTGGSILAATRNYDKFLERLSRRISSGYFLEYSRREGETQLHDLEVQVPGSDGLVVYPTQVIGVEPNQRLANEVIARLRFDTGRDPLHIEASLGAAEPYEGDKVVRTVGVTVPVDKLTMEVDGDTARGRIGVIVSVMEEGGEIVQPRIVQFPVEVSADQLGSGVRSLAKVRLLFGPTSKRLAVAVRDEASGLASTTALRVPEADA